MRDPALDLLREVDDLKAELAARRADVAAYEAYCHSLENAILTAYGDEGMVEIQTLRATSGIPSDGRMDSVPIPESEV